MQYQILAYGTLRTQAFQMDKKQWILLIFYYNIYSKCIMFCTSPALGLKLPHGL